MGASEPRSSPPPPDPAAHRTGSHPAVVLPIAEPPPRFETVADRALRIALQVRADIGHAPIPSKRDPGSGLWMTLEEVRTTCIAILARLDAADAASAQRGGWAARVGWKVVDLLVIAVFGLAAAWLSGHLR